MIILILYIHKYTRVTHLYVRCIYKQTLLLLEKWRIQNIHYAPLNRLMTILTCRRQPKDAGAK